MCCICDHFLLNEGGQKNPFRMKPSYEQWAPWIGRETRKGPTVLNTEYHKLQTNSPQDHTAEVHATEERLVDELMNIKVTFSRLCLCTVSVQFNSL